MSHTRMLVAIAALAVLSTMLSGPAIAKQPKPPKPPAPSTTLELSANPVSPRAGTDVTLRSMTTAPAATAAAIDAGRVVFQMATDNARRPTAAAKVHKWLALNPLGQKARAGMASLEVDLDAWGVGPGMSVGLRAHYLGGAGKGRVKDHSSPATALAVSGGHVEVVRIEVEPAAALLTSVGDSRSLRATAFDASDQSVAASFTWSSTRPDTVAVDGTGTISAGAFGSAQVRAAVDGVSSPAVLVVVAAPADGAILVDDDEIAGPLEQIEPAADCPLATYRVALTFSPAIGDVLISSGVAPLQGRVRDVSDGGAGSTLVTLCLLPLPEIFPHLVLDEHIDLSQAPVIFPAGTSDYYDVVRTGDTFDFIPKTGASSPAARSSRVALNSLDLPLAPSTFSLGIFEECESSTPLSSLPIQLSATPAVSFTLNPSLDVVWTDDLHRVVVNAEPKVTATIGVTATAAFEAKITCKHEAFSFQVLAPGALGVLLGGVIPVGFGFEISGKVTVASLGLGVSGFVKANAQLGVNCAAECEFVRSLGNFDKDWNVTTNGISLSDIRLEPSFEAFGYVKFEAGNPFLEFLRFDAVGAKVGLKLAGSFATRLGQVSDAAYASDYKLTLEGSAKAGTKMSQWLAALGLPSIAALELKVTVNLANSPTGRLIADRTSYASGDPVHARARLDSSNLTFLTIYNVDKLILVRYFGGATTELATLNATSGQQDFDFSFNAPAAMDADQLYVMVVTRILPLSILELEVAKGQPLTVAVTPASVNLAAGAQQQFSATVTGTASTAVTWSATCGAASSTGLYTAPSSGTTCTVTAASVELPSATASATVTLGGVSVVVSPHSVTIPPFGGQQFSAEVTGTAIDGVTWSTTCGQIDQTGFFSAPETDGVCSITATSQSDPTRSDTATATIGRPTLTISPEVTMLAPGGTQQFTATLDGADPGVLEWDASCGTVNAGGLYTAPAIDQTFFGQCGVWAWTTSDGGVIRADTVAVYVGTPEAPTGDGYVYAAAGDSSSESWCGGPGGVQDQETTRSGTATASQGGANSASTIGVDSSVANNVLIISGSLSSQSTASAAPGPDSCGLPHGAGATGHATAYLTIVVRGGRVPYTISAAATHSETDGRPNVWLLFETASRTAGIVSDLSGPHANGQIFTGTSDNADDWPPVADHGWLWAGTYTLLVVAESGASAVSTETAAASSTGSASLQFELVIGVSP